MPIELLSQMYLKVEGSPVSKEFMEDLKELVIDTSLHLPDMFTIHLNDPTLKWIDDKMFSLGKTVEVSGKEGGSSSSVTLITAGEITAIEPDLTESGATTVIIRGYDKAHRLHRGKKTRTYPQASHSDIVNKIANEAGISAVIDRTSEVYEHVFQDWQTDIDFLRELARKEGFYLYVKDGKLYFQKNPIIYGTTPELIWTDNLISFQARFTSGDQVGQTEVLGWDANGKKQIVGKSSAPKYSPFVNNTDHGGKAADAAFGSSKDTLNYKPVWSQAEAEALAQAVLDDHCQAFFEAEGICTGNPNVRAGCQVEVKNVGSRFSGKYTVTRAVHRSDFDGYVTEFEISGLRPNTLAKILENPVKNPYGVVIGLVTNVNDPKDLARVKVKYPTISNDLESNWARVATPMAGKQMGFEFIPEVNDEVLVAFEYDDINKPYILGGLWNGKDKPPVSTADLVKGGKVQKRVIHSRSGHVITLDDSDGEEKITIVDKTKKNSIEIDSVKNTLTIKTDGAISLETKDDVSIKGKNITFEATANATMKATSNINLEATSKATLKGNSGVDVNASGPANIKGAVINLN